MPSRKPARSACEFGIVRRVHDRAQPIPFGVVPTQDLLRLTRGGGKSRDKFRFGAHEFAFNDIAEQRCFRIETQALGGLGNGDQAAHSGRLHLRGEMPEIDGAAPFRPEPPSYR